MNKRLNLYIALVITVILIIAGVWYQQSNKLVKEIKQNSIEVVDEKGQWSFSIPDRYKHFWLDYQDPSKIVGITLQEYENKGFSDDVDYTFSNGAPAGLEIYNKKPDIDISDFILSISSNNNKTGILNEINYKNTDIFTLEYFNNGLNINILEYYYLKDNFVFKAVKVGPLDNPKTINSDKEFGKLFAFIDETFKTEINNFKNNTWSLSVPNKYKVKSLGENKDGSTTLELSYVKPTDFAEEFAPSPLLTIYELKSNQKISDLINSQREREPESGEIVITKQNNLDIYSFDSPSGIAGVTYYYIQKDNYIFELHKIYSGEIPDEFLNILNFVDATFREK